MLVLPCVLKMNSSNLLCENINDLLERQSVRQLDTSARREVKWSLELRQAQLDNESTMQQRETCVFLRLGTEPQEALRQQRAHMVHEQHQLVQERRSSNKFRSALHGIGAASVFEDPRINSQERDVLRQEARHFQDAHQRFDQAAHAKWLSAIAFRSD